MKAIKIFVILALVLIVIGLAYVQAIYSRQDSGKSTSEKSTSGSTIDKFILTEQYANLVDSLRQFYIDSLQETRELTTLTNHDSADVLLTIAVKDSLNHEIDQLNVQLSEAEKAIGDLKTAKQEQFERLVYNFYSREMASLPADLSNYERSVSLKEIKAKAKEYFDISSNSLDKIVKKYGN